MIGPFGVYLDEETGLWQLQPLPHRGGGAGPGLGSKSPRIVTSATGVAGVGTRASREDHEHRLEMRIHANGEAPAPAGRPVVNFIGATVADDAENDRVDVTIDLQGPGLGHGGTAEVMEVDNVSPASYLDVAFTVPASPTGLWAVEVEASAYITLDFPGDVSGGGISVNYWLNVDDLVPFSSRVVSIASAAASVQNVTAHTLGQVTLAEGSYTAQLFAMSNLVADSSAQIRTRTMSIRLAAVGV